MTELEMANFQEFKTQAVKQTSTITESQAHFQHISIVVQVGWLIWQKLESSSLCWPPVSSWWIDCYAFFWNLFIYFSSITSYHVKAVKSILQFFYFFSCKMAYTMLLFQSIVHFPLLLQKRQFLYSWNPQNLLGTCSSCCIMILWQMVLYGKKQLILSSILFYVNFEVGNVTESRNKT